MWSQSYLTQKHFPLKFSWWVEEKKKQQQKKKPVALDPDLWELCTAAPLAGCVFLPGSAELFLIDILERS